MSPVRGPAWSGRPLRLPAPPDPEHAAEHAQRVVVAAQSISRVVLDFSPASLRDVDAILDDFAESGSNAVAETVFAFGCYIGEVLVRHSGYHWVATPAGLSATLGPLTVYRESTGARVNPISKAFKRVDYGPVDDLMYFYDIFTRNGVSGPE
ncbi:hypothetical protein [Mycolicibacterium neoaurum]|uniref:hypothetical protein n=1 Tax=Mycolicibacterium neoaurum TaxID=1795 RepID=UPI001F4CBB19|nr:hypothetical protein [Mycolicibacterium neoaurum]